jgi:hypothetical protein
MKGFPALTSADYSIFHFVWFETRAIHAITIEGQFGRQDLLRATMYFT